MIKRTVFACIALLHIFSTSAQAPKSYTSSELLLQLKKLNTVGSVLYIAAHPDDENTRLIAYLANEKCLRTGYLSLTRGDGGQNLIGPEQGVELGVVRTQELLAARRVDGGEQFFTRAYDFGFSKTPEETFSKWNHDSILADVVWVIRNFRPDIIITRFATDGSGGHGHHTASAILAEEAFDAAADPSKFTEQLKYVKPWKTRRMFHNSTARFFNPNADLSHLIKLDVGGYNPILGKSYGEIAAESRSMHRSQGFGSARQRGESFEYFKPVKGDTTGLKDIFDGIDFSWNRIKGMEDVSKKIKKCMNEFSPTHPQDIDPDLLLISRLLVNKDANLFCCGGQYEYLNKLLQSILLACNGITIDAFAESPQVALGHDTTRFSVSIINRANASLHVKQINFPEYKTPYKPDTILPRNINYVAKFNIPPGGVYSTLALNEYIQPYWVEAGIANNRFNYATTKYLTEYDEIIFPKVEISGLLGKDFIQSEKRIQYKWVDPSKGELYRPLVITPPVMINMHSEVYAFPDLNAKEVKVTVRAGKDNVKFDLSFIVPEGWKISAPDMQGDPLPRAVRRNLTLNKKGDESTFSVFVQPPAGAGEGTLKVEAVIDGTSYTHGIKELKYDHIPVQTLFPDAEAKLIRLDVNRKLKRIGYIPGAGDEVAQCLTQLGYEVVTITDDMLARENLNLLEAIVVGVRAYNTNEKLTSYKQRLMEFVNNGGNLIVQYNTNSFAGPFKGDIGPYPFKITRDRVTDENAVVNFDLPDHPVLNTPNKITSKDFEGWIQERCIYSGADTTGKYQMPISMADANEKPNKGSLLITKYGKGHFVYTGLVFFRELPAGVQGAYRLFVNMIEIGKQ